MRTMRTSRRWLAALALVAGLALAALYGVRAWHQWQFAQRVARGELRVETLRGWMTLGYVAQVHGVPASELRAALGLPAQGHDERSLRQWFDAAGIEPDVGRRRIEDLILARRAASGASSP